MATSKEATAGTIPITEEEREKLEDTIRTALSGVDYGVYSVDVVGEPNREGDSEYAVAIIKSQDV